MNTAGTRAAPIDALVHTVSYSTPDTLTFDLRAGDELPPFETGAHIDVHIGAGVIRQYSLCNPPAERHRYVICVRRDDLGRGGSKALHHTVRVGQRITISPPRNHFALEPADRYVLLVGGIGLTPLLAMSEHLAAEGIPFELHVYARDADAVPLRERLGEPHLAGPTTIHLSATGDSIRSGLPSGLDRPTPATRIYTCGPEGFMQAVVDHTAAAGWPAETLHQERFAPAPAAGDAPAGEAFAVVVGSTGQRVEVGPDDTIAEVLLAEGIEIEMSCEQGMCGACLTGVLAGIPDHRDEVQSDAERASNRQLTICCSRSRTAELVLDL